MESIGWAILACVVSVIVGARFYSNKVHSKGPLISFSNFRFDPPSGSALLSHQPITATFNYSYTNSEQEFYVWVIVDTNDVPSTHQGSTAEMVPGIGEISRYFYLQQAGKIESIKIEVKNSEFELVHTESLDVQYDVASNAEMEALASDGKGSKIKSVSLDVDPACVLPLETNVYIDIEYDIDAEAGLDIWAIPVTDCQMTYEGSKEKLNGQGVITKGFSISEECHLTRVRLIMENSLGEAIVDTQLEVDIRFKGEAA